MRTILHLLLTLTLTPAFGQAPARRESAALPPGTKAHRDLVYVENGHERHRLDLFLPEKSSPPVPVIIWMHGGGWQNGSKDGCPPLRAGYVAQGYAVASINYRLSGHAIFPAQIEDCKAAIRWLRANAGKYGLDPQRIGAWGSSAGGHLVALLGTSGDVKDFDVGAHRDQSSRVQAVCDFYGPTDFITFATTPGYERHADAGSAESKLLGGLVLENKERAARVNPITYVSADDPPFLIVHGDKDPTVPLNQSQLLHDALKRAGVPTHFHTIRGAGHGGPGFSDPAIGEMVRGFFDRVLRNSDGGTLETKTSESTATTTAPERKPPATGATSRGLPWEAILARHDGNKDGQVSRAEFTGPAPVFERLDRNRDGTLTRDEHEAAFPPARR